MPNMKYMGHAVLDIITFNRRAQRALGRSPEEKVTVEPFTEDSVCCTLNIKALADFYKNISRFPYKSDLSPDRAPFYTSGKIWTFFLATNQNNFNNFGRGPGIIPVEFGQISISGSREEVVWGSSFPYIIQS